MSATHIKHRELIIENDKQATEEGRAKCRHSSAKIRGRFNHVLPEVQEAGLHGVHEDPAGLHHGLFHHGCYRLLHQTCVHSHQQHHSVLSTSIFLSKLKMFTTFENDSVSL